VKIFKNRVRSAIVLKGIKKEKTVHLFIKKTEYYYYDIKKARELPWLVSKIDELITW
jgi:hypothetical protein